MSAGQSTSIKDGNGHVLGRLLEATNGRIIAQTPNGSCLGVYDPAFDKTFTMTGGVISTGNTTAGLIFKK
jgi:hypothetical protein